MAKKGKTKISKVKKNNQTTNKMKKQGKLRLQRHRQTVQKQRQPTVPQKEYSSDSDSASGDEWADMLDEDEQKYILTRLAKQPQLLSNVPVEEPKITKQDRKRKRQPKPPTKATPGSDSGAESESEDTDSEVEEKYEKELEDRPIKRMRPLLPIKTKHGLMEREEECADTESEDEIKHKPAPKPKKEESEPSDSDSGMEGTDEGEAKNEGEARNEGEVIGAVELMAARRDKLNHDKLRIGALCSSLLESPDKKLKNLFPILYLMEESLKDGAPNLHSVRKLATLSACEVFKDILPEYQIRHQDYSNVKLKKDTLTLYKHEKELLEFYKRYLQRLEKAVVVLRRKKGDTRKPDQSSISLALISLRCMCDLLVSKPYFNYATNIAQSVIPYLDCRDQSATGIVAQCATQVFADDNKGEITLCLVRLINQLVKRRGDRLNPSALDCLLTLKIRDVDLDAAADLNRKKKQEEKHKKRIVNLSKKEKKRAKKLKEVERELLETEAQESDIARKKQMTEVTNTVFHIYFRLLKCGPSSKLLAAALNGLAKFTHVINLEFYSDLVAILGRLVEDDQLSSREKLLCVRTVLCILASSGDALNVDPAKFHTALYAALIRVHSGVCHDETKIIVDSVAQVCSRARRVSAHSLRAFAKRLLLLATNVQHNGALACFKMVHLLAQQSKAVSSLFETDEDTIGSGRFEPQLDSPEHCNAWAARPAEMCSLRRHYHPAAREAAVLLSKGEMIKEFHKLSPVQIFDMYDGSQMAFKPAIPPPKKEVKPAKYKNDHVWALTSFQQECEAIEGNVPLVISKR